MAQPPYPPVARRLLQEGTVTLLLLVNEDGAIARGMVERSTGFRSLDQAALDGARTWSFNPATLDGKPHCMWGRFAVTFRLKDDLPPLDAALIHPEARELAGMLLTEGTLTAGFARAPLLRASDAATRVMSDVLPLLIEPDVLRDVQDEYAAMLTKYFSREQLAGIVAFYSTPEGRQWQDVQDERVEGMAAGDAVARDALVKNAQARGKCELPGITQ